MSNVTRQVIKANNARCLWFYPCPSVVHASALALDRIAIQQGMDTCFRRYDDGGEPLPLAFSVALCLREKTALMIAGSKKTRFTQRPEDAKKAFLNLPCSASFAAWRENSFPSLAGGVVFAAGKNHGATERNSRASAAQ